MVVNNTAAATLRQLVIHVFEKVLVEDEQLAKSPAKQNASISSLSPCAKDAYMLFQDLCLLGSGETPLFLLKMTTLPKPFGLELIESILTNHYQLLKNHPEILNLLKEKVCPLVIRSFSDKNEFPLIVRLLRVVKIIIFYFHDIMVELLFLLVITLNAISHLKPLFLTKDNGGGNIPVAT